MEIIVLVAALFSFTNTEFINTMNSQMKDGYEWSYVGKTKPSGVPAITIKPQSGNEYILFKLKK
tara:strand:- start:374 stop:565 length:192 start_codon:yes stop_codon:yes gene_type:complete